MNKVILMGRLTRDPEVRYTNSQEPMAIARYGLAVNRRFKGANGQDVDFINCVAFGKSAEFAQKYFQKGQMVSVVGSLRIESFDDKNTGQKRWSTEVAVDEQHFAESKSSFESRKSQGFSGGQNNGYQTQPDTAQQTADFAPIEENVDDEELPF